MPTLSSTTSRPRAPIAHRSPPKRILLATAGDPDSRGALHLVAALARRGGATVMALAVEPPFPHNLSTFVSIRTPLSVDEEGRREALADLKRSVRRLPGADAWLKRAIIGMPADAINEVASTWKASMIILGIGRHGPVDRIFGSETAVAVIRRARAPVIAVSRHVRGLPSCALAAIDFTPASLTAATLAGNLLDADGTLIIAHVCAFAGIKPRDGDLVDVYRAGARAKLDDAVREVRRRTRRRVESVMLEGEPGDALVKYARRSRCDLIALGGHEQGLMDRILLGSVRTRVVRSASCSVLIAPPGTD